MADEQALANALTNTTEKLENLNIKQDEHPIAIEIDPDAITRPIRFENGEFINPNVITFSAEDKAIIADVINCRKNIFLHGPAGTGKSTLIGEIIRQFSELYQDEIAHDTDVLAVCAMTGAASINLTGGTTIHRFSGILLGDGTAEELLKRIKYKRATVKRWHDVKLMIIDEISMMGGALFEKLDYIARKYREQLPFGGIQLVICGDLLQLPPINDKWIFESEAFAKLNFTIHNLTKSRRYTNTGYFDMLLRLRLGERNETDMAVLKSRYKIYKEMKFSATDIKPTILYSKKIDVDFYNMAELAKLTTKEYVFMAKDKIDIKRNVLEKISKTTEENQQTYYKNLLSEGIPEKIVLKAGAQVMLKKNLDFKAGLVNGSRGVVIGFIPEQSIVNVKFLACPGVIVPIKYSEWKIQNKEILACREQIPLILGWAYTVHKSQGATLDCVICDLGSSVFANAQAYVALSRVRNLESLYLSEFEERSIRADSTVLKFIESIKNDKK